MVRVKRKEKLNETVGKMELEAELIAKKAEPGQFVIVRAKEESERIPLTIADYDREEGTVTIIYQIVGAGTMELDTVEEGGFLQDLVGPLGKASETEGLQKVAVVGGGVGCAIAYPLAKKLHRQGAEVHSVIGFRNKGLVILEDEKSYLKELFDKNPTFAEKFTSEISIPIMTNDELVTFGKIYAYDEDYRIDDSATVALYNRISEMQTPEYPV